MLENTAIQMHWVDVPSAVEVPRSNVVVQKKIIIEKIYTLQIFRGIIFEKLP